MERACRRTSGPPHGGGFEDRWEGVGSFDHLLGFYRFYRVGFSLVGFRV